MRNPGPQSVSRTDSVPGVLTLAVGALLRALASRRRARSYSLFSDSSFTAASQISSLLGFAWRGQTHTHTQNKHTGVMGKGWGKANVI